MDAARTERRLTRAFPPGGSESRRARLHPERLTGRMDMIGSRELDRRTCMVGPVATEQESEEDVRLRALLERCASRDSAALERLYQDVAPLLYAALVRMLKRRSVAEEALQDVFVSIWERARQYTQARGRPVAWMMSIARYRAIDLLRHERFAPALMPEPPDPPAE